MSNQTTIFRFEGFVLLREHSWDKEAFYRQYQSDWDTYLVDTSADATSLVATTDGMTCCIALVSGPALEDMEPYQVGAFPWEELVEVRKRSTAHLVLSVEAHREADPLEVATVFAQMAASLLADADNAQGLWADNIYHDSPEAYRGLALEVRESPNPDLWVGYAIATLDERLVCYSVGLHKFNSPEIEIVCPTEDTEYTARDVMDMLIGEVVVEGQRLGNYKNISYNEEVALSMKEAEGVVLEGQTVYQIELPWRLKTQRSSIFGIILASVIGLGLIFYGVYLYFDLSEFELVGGHRTLWGPAAAIYKLAESFLPGGGKVLAPLLSIGVGLSLIIPSLKKT